MVDRDKLVKLLGMLGSAHDGEVLNAARHAQELLKSGRHTWDEVVAREASENDLQALVMAVDRSFNGYSRRSVPEHDRLEFLKLRERYFSNTLSETDKRRLAYYRDMYVQNFDSDVPF